MSQHVCIICGETLSDSLSVCPRCGNNPTAALHLPIGTTLHDGKYAVGKQLGQGGFGITYKAHHTELRRTVVIKELFPGFAFRRHIGVSVPTSRKQEFDQEKVNVINEARVVAGLSSPNIVDVYDVFSENDTAYVVMEYLQGQSLQQQIDTSGSLQPDDVHMIGIQMCNALDEIHRNSFLHRDIKPANIMLTNDGRIVLIDFGSARRYQANITSQHTQIFTHNFAAPEQFSPEARFGPYTDIFGLGATLYTALTGSPPTPSVERLQLDDNRVHFPSGLPNDLCQAIQWALNCRIDERPETAAEFQEALSGTRRIEAMAPTTLNPNNRVSATNVPRAQHYGSHAGRGTQREPYEFNGKEYFVPSALVAAMEQDWDQAILEWKFGFITDWMKGAGKSQRLDFDQAVAEINSNSLLNGLDDAEDDLILFDGKYSNSETAVLERQMLVVMQALDPSWTPTYRGVPLGNVSEISDWCASDEDFAVPAVYKLLQQRILVAHPDESVVELDWGVRREFAKYIEILSERFSAQEIENGNYAYAEYPQYLIFAALVNPSVCMGFVADAELENDAMKIGWFRQLVFLAKNSPGLAIALPVLAQKAKKAQQQHRSFTWGCLLFLFVIFVFFMIALNS